MDHEGDLSALLANPDFFPLRIDQQRRAVAFVQMSRDTFRRSSFLDHRVILAGPAARLVAEEELFARLAPGPAGGAVHFILHGAFCGSTLLARHFEELPRCLVLKEPELLAQIARLGNADPAGVLRARAWGDWFDAALALLSRADPDDVAVVIKAPDQFNWVASQLLDRQRTAKVIFLCAPLRVFLLSALKSQERRAWIRSRARGLRLQLAQLPLRDGLVAEELSDAQLGAALWLLNAFLCSNLLSRPDSQRILVMNSEELIGRPQETFRGAVEFLGLTRDPDICGALGRFRPIDYYSKEPDVPVRFDATTRGATLAEIEQRLGHEVDAATEWAARMSADRLLRSPFPFE